MYGLLFLLPFLLLSNSYLFVISFIAFLEARKTIAPESDLFLKFPLIPALRPEQSDYDRESN